MSEPKVNILKIQEIVYSKLAIPSYQRAYTWKAVHVNQLLNDLLENYNAQKNYRLGTIVIHENLENNKNEIVDGQQRLTTLTILLYLFASSSNKEEMGALSLLDAKQNHSESITNIVNNKKTIEQFLSLNIQDKDAFNKYILNKCEVVCVTLTSLEEAFQFFDSQNSRGKTLAPYDLLKAFHLRELKAESSVVYRCVEQWEKAVDAPEINLEKIMSKTLFRLRRWGRKQKAESFSKNEIAVFKGVKESDNYLYLTPLLASNALYTMYQNNSLWVNPQFSNPGFQIPQTIINGKLFFHYIQNYLECYQFLFDRKTGYLSKIKIDKDTMLLNYLNSYSGHNRAGDDYIRTLFECLVLRYYDKFGKHDLERAIRYCLKWSYRIRLLQDRVYFSSVENEVNGNNSLLIHLEYANTPKEFFEFELPNIKNEVGKYQEVEKLLNLEIENGSA